MIQKGFPNIPNKIDDQTALRYLLHGFSKLCKLLLIIHNEVFLYDEKSTCWCGVPDSQILLLTALILCEIDACILYTDMDTQERVALIREFNMKCNSVMILIVSYQLSSARLNLQALCHNSHHFDILMSESVSMQAVSHFRHLRQTEIVKAYYYNIKKSFNMRQLENNASKAVPGLVTELNKDLFKLSLNETRDKIDLDH